MTEEKMVEIFKEKVPFRDFSNYNIFLGLQILDKYTSNLICATEHDILYSESIEILIERGITEDDCKKLSDFGWMIDGDCDCLYHFT